jgi:hypothetical protein
MDATPTTLEVVAPSPAESALTLALATLNNNVTSVSMLQAHDVQCRLGGVGGSYQTVPQRQRRPPSNRKANALQRVILKMGQEAIDQIWANWISMATHRAGSEWQ